MQWQPPPLATQNGQIVGYKLRYRKTARKTETFEILVDNQLSQLITGECCHLCIIPVFLVMPLTLTNVFISRAREEHRIQLSGCSHDCKWEWTSH